MSRQLPPRRFEEIVGELLEKQGYGITLTPATRDGGFDIYAAKKGGLVTFLYIVECKRCTPAQYRRSRDRAFALRRGPDHAGDRGGGRDDVFFSSGGEELCRDIQYQMQLRDDIVLQQLIRDLPSNEAAGSDARRVAPLMALERQPDPRILTPPFFQASKFAHGKFCGHDQTMGREARAKSRRKPACETTAYAKEGRLGELLARIRELLASGAGVDDYFATLDELASIMKMSMGSVVEPGQALYRATKHHKTVPQHVRDISYPSPDCVTFLGRCNRAGQPVFYCSSDRNCVLEEVWPKEGDLVVRATWRTTKRAFLHDIGYSTAVFNRAGTARDIPSKYIEFASRLDNNAQQIRDFIGLAFTDTTSNKYPLTAAIAECYLRSDDIVGVMYPSITRKGDCDNLGLRPGFVDRGLQLVAAEAIRVRHWDLQNPDGSGVADLKGVDSDGTLVWAYTDLELTALPPGEARHIFMNFGETVTCQNDGELIINGRRYSVRAGFRIESQPVTIVVKDAAGNVVPPMAV